MTGYCYGQGEPIEKCPYCGTFCLADFVDIGVGMTQCGPFHCETCGASEIGPHDKERVLSDAEQDCGWYAPGMPPGSSANVMGGQIVGHAQMTAAYREEFVGNPLYADKSYVEAWFERTRGSLKASQS